MIKNHRGAENAEEKIEERGSLNNSDTNGNDIIRSLPSMVY